MKTHHFITFAAASALYLGIASPVFAADMPSSSATATVAAVLPPATVAVVNGVSILSNQLDQAVLASRQPDTPELRKFLKQELIARELFRQKAEAAHYDARPEVQQVVNAVRVATETQLYLKDQIHPEPVTDAQVKQRYDDVVASLGAEEYKIRIISVTDAATANTVLSKLKSGSAFDALAQQYSVAPSKASGGAMDWVSFKTPAVEGKTQSLPLALAQAVSKLPEGGVTATPVLISEGANTLFVIVKLDQKRATVIPTFDQSQKPIRQQLEALALQKASASVVAEMLKGASIQQ